MPKIEPAAWLVERQFNDQWVIESYHHNRATAEQNLWQRQVERPRWANGELVARRLVERTYIDTVQLMVVGHIGGIAPPEPTEKIG